MKKNKITIVLITILLIFLSIIIFLLININNKKDFVKPDFDKDAVTTIPDKIDYKKMGIKVIDGYSLYIQSLPTIKKDNYLNIDLISYPDNKIWIKVRILNEKEEVVAETGLIKPGEYLEKVKLNKKLKVNDKITYKVMGYEVYSYLSAGSIRLNTKVGE